MPTCGLLKFKLKTVSVEDARKIGDWLEESDAGKSRRNYYNGKREGKNFKKKEKEIIYFEIILKISNF